MQLYIEGEIVGRARTPAFHHSFVRHGVKAGIDLHHFEMLRVPGESFVRCHFFWIPALDKSGIGPARSADENPGAICLRFSLCRHGCTERLALKERKPQLSELSFRNYLARA